jgi:muramidase (phage lysozyme)
MKKMMELKFQPIKHGRTERRKTRLELTWASLPNIKTNSSRD